MPDIIKSNWTRLLVVVAAGYAAFLATRMTLALIASFILGDVPVPLFWPMSGFSNSVLSFATIGFVIPVAAFACVAMILWDQIDDKNGGENWQRKAITIWLLLMALQATSIETSNVFFEIFLLGQLSAYACFLFATLNVPLLALALVLAYGLHRIHKPGGAPALEASDKSFQSGQRQNILIITVCGTWIVVVLAPILLSGSFVGVTSGQFPSQGWLQQEWGNPYYFIYGGLVLLPVTAYGIVTFALWDRLANTTFLSRALFITVAVMVTENIAAMLAHDIYAAVTLHHLAAFGRSAQMTGTALSIAIPICLGAYLASQSKTQLLIESRS